MRLKCASAICGDWPSVNGAGGNVIRVPWHCVTPWSDRSLNPCFAVASIAEFGRQTNSGGAHQPRALLQRLDRQAPDRPGNADGADHVAAEIAHWQRNATQFGIELAVVERHAGAAHFC